MRESGSGWLVKYTGQMAGQMPHLHEGERQGEARGARRLDTREGLLVQVLGEVVGRQLALDVLAAYCFSLLIYLLFD